MASTLVITIVSPDAVASVKQTLQLTTAATSPYTVTGNQELIDRVAAHIDSIALGTTQNTSVVITLS